MKDRKLSKEGQATCDEAAAAAASVDGDGHDDGHDDSNDNALDTVPIQAIAPMDVDHNNQGNIYTPAHTQPSSSHDAPSSGATATTTPVTLESANITAGISTQLSSSASHGGHEQGAWISPPCTSSTDSAGILTSRHMQANPMDNIGIREEGNAVTIPFQGKREAPAPGTGAGPGGGVAAATSSSAAVMEEGIKSPPEMLLNEIAESLRDTARKPSFAKIQSVQVC